MFCFMHYNNNSEIETCMIQLLVVEFMNFRYRNTTRDCVRSNGSQVNSGIKMDVWRQWKNELLYLNTLHCVFILKFMLKSDTDWQLSGIWKLTDMQCQTSLCFLPCSLHIVQTLSVNIRNLDLVKYQGVWFPWDKFSILTANLAD